MSKYPALTQTQLAELRGALAHAIRELRLSRKMTQREVADRLEWNRSTIAMIETGAQAVTLEQCWNLASLFEISLLEIVKPADAVFMGMPVLRTIRRR